MAISVSLAKIAAGIPPGKRVTKLERSSSFDEIEIYEPPETQIKKPAPQQNSYGGQKDDRFIDFANLGTNF